MAPSWPQVGARMTQLVFTAARLRAYSCTVSCLHPPWVPKWIQDIRNSRQDGTKNAQVGPKLVENGPKMAPVGLILGLNLQNLTRSWSKVASSGSQNCMKAYFLKIAQKTMKNNDFHYFFVLNFGLRCRALLPKWCYIGRNWPQVGESCFQVRSKLRKVDTSWSQGRPI